MPHSQWADLPTDLEQQGWSECEDFLTQEECEVWLKMAQDNQELMHKAGTGKGSTFKAQSVRGDHILWLDLDQPLYKSVKDKLERIKNTLNSTLYLGLRDIEAHWALYQNGQGYGKHKDAFCRTNTRVVSLVVYLTPNRTELDGGQLRLYVDKPMEFLPQAQRAVCFMSADIEHEVLPTQTNRWSLAVWFGR